MNHNRFIFPWCFLMCAAALIPAAQNVGSLNPYFAPLDSSRWIHFLVYAVVAAYPVSKWQNKQSIYLVIAFQILSVLLEVLPTGTRFLPVLRLQTIPADLFGLAAGILLGLNIKTMRRSNQLGSAHSPDKVRQDIF